MFVIERNFRATSVFDMSKTRAMFLQYLVDACCGVPGFQAAVSRNLGHILSRMFSRYVYHYSRDDRCSSSAVYDVTGAGKRPMLLKDANI